MTCHVRRGDVEMLESGFGSELQWMDAVCEPLEARQLAAGSPRRHRNVETRLVPQAKLPSSKTGPNRKRTGLPALPSSRCAPAVNRCEHGPMRGLLIIRDPAANAVLPPSFCGRSPTATPERTPSPPPTSSTTSARVFRTPAPTQRSPSHDVFWISSLPKGDAEGRADGFSVTRRSVVSSLRFSALRSPLSALHPPPSPNPVFDASIPSTMMRLF